MKEFQILAATSLMCQGKVPRGRPSLQTPPPAKKHCVQPGPQLDLNLNLLKFSNGRLLSNDWQSEKLEIT
jgi:hypothetical protein